MSVSRRSFLKGSAATAALTLTGGSIRSAIAGTKAGMQPGPGNKWPGRVVTNFNKNVFSGSSVDETVAKKMVDDAIMLLSGEESVGAAWKAVFPSSLSSQSKIAIKINLLNSGNPKPHPATVQAITEGLLAMDVNLPAGNITIYDMNNGSSMDGTGYNDSRFPGINRVKDSAGEFGDGALNNRSYARSLNAADFLINVFSPRGHNTGSTFTIGFKSHYGTYSNPGGLHGGNAPQNLRDINCTGPVYLKTVLSMCSGLYGMIEGHGPTGGEDPYLNYAKTVDSTVTLSAQPPCTVILSTDPISCDMQTIKMMRLNKNPAGKYGVDDMPAYLQASAGISGALSGTTYNIGIIDEAEMDIGKIINGEIVEELTPARNSLKRNGVLQTGVRAIFLKQQGITYIEFAVPHKYIGSEATVELFDMKGSVVYASRYNVSGVRTNFSWNGRLTSGQSAAQGKYIVRVTVGAMQLSDTLLISH